MPVIPMTSKLEFTISKEAASVAATASDLHAIHTILSTQLPKPSFQAILAKVVLPLIETYRTPMGVIAPLTAIQTESAFSSQFAEAWKQYKTGFDETHALPRRYVDESYEAYLILSETKEAKTTYPILRRTFDRLYLYMDKYINNDSWLLMNIDNVYKMLNLLLAEIDDQISVDIEESWFRYQLAFSGLTPFLGIVNDKIERLEQSPALKSVDEKLAV